MKLTKIALCLLALPFAVAALAPPASAAEGARFSAYKGNKGRFNPSWTPAVLAAIKQQRPRLERASDIEKFCPGYRGASEDQKNNCWLRLTSGIMSWESGYKEGIVGDSGRSCGLMQIQPMNCRREGMSCASLRKAANNARCGVRMMGDLISRDKVISNEVMEQGRHRARRARRGLGRGGWTVMMKSMMIGKMQAGHLDQIHAGVITYRSPERGTQACADDTILLAPGIRYHVAGL